MPATREQIARAPKALLHDHLDGGLRPATVIDLARVCGYQQLPTHDADELAAWFVGAASSGSTWRHSRTQSP
jgi:adenosine deaminase